MKEMTDKEASETSTRETTLTYEKLPEPGSRERLLAERKLVRKLDMRLLPTIFLIYIMNYIDVRILH